MCCCLVQFIGGIINRFRKLEFVVYVCVLLSAIQFIKTPIYDISS